MRGGSGRVRVGGAGEASYRVVSADTMKLLPIRRGAGDNELVLGMRPNQIAIQTGTAWETPYRPTEMWLMGGLQRPILCIRTHPRWSGRRHQSRRNTSDRGAPRQLGKTFYMAVQGGEVGWLTQPARCRGNTHYRFRHVGFGSPYLRYVE